MLFNLTGTNFKSAGKASGVLDKLAGSQYETSTYRYPEDLGAGDKGHYMIININEQRLTAFGGTGATGDRPTAIRNQQSNPTNSAGPSQTMKSYGDAITAINNSDFAQSVFGGVSSAVDSLSNAVREYGGDVGGTAASGIQGAKGFASGVHGLVMQGAKSLSNGSIRAQKRILSTVALYMPDTLAFTTNQSYQDVGAGGQMLTALAAGGKTAIDILKSNASPFEKGQALGVNLSPFILSNLSKQAGGLGQIAFSQAFGVVQNPMLEVLYSSPEFRTFRFDFQFYPRSEKEAKLVQGIIQLLRFHQAPEVAQGGSNGYFLVPPSEFDISFYYKGKVNPNIPSISTCVLTSMDVDYAPGGFSAYEVPNQAATMGGTGMPVAIRMSLQFKETEILTKASYTSNVKL
jgi:hypothetical protein